VTRGVEMVARAGAAGLTFVARLDHAPFPIEDRDDAYFDGRDAATGERFHTGPGGPLAETRHYRDDRVLFHVPRHFDPARPFDLLVFFHGHRAELQRTLIGEHGLPRQVDESRRNVVLVAPQLALDAPDSHPGKLAEPDGLARLLDEAAEILAAHVKGLSADAVRRAPVVVAAFSGGYRTAAVCLERGGVERRVHGVLLIDAIYGEVERLSAWLAGAGRRGFFLCLYGESSREGTDALVDAAGKGDIAVLRAYPRRLSPGIAYAAWVETPHDLIPRDGPPAAPIADFLKRLP
jgi:hypothetical protein